MSPPLRSLLPLLALLLLLAACSSNDDGGTTVPPPTPTPSRIEASGSTSFTGVVGAPVSSPPAVLVTGSDGQVMTAAAVTFQVTAGGGHVLGGTTPTNAQGIATVGGWILGTSPGVNTLSATVAALPAVTFTAMATAGSPARLGIASGDGQQGDVGTPLANPLVVRVADAFDNPLPNVSVAFAVTAGGGTLSSTSGMTDAQGRASTMLTLNAPGVSTVGVTSPSIAGASSVFSASTGPTITGQVLPTTGAVRPFAGASLFRGGADTKPSGPGGRPLAAESPRLTAAQAASLIPTSGRLVVTYRPEAFALPASPQAFRLPSVSRQAVSAYAAALAQYETAGLIERREISPAIAAARVLVAPGKDAADVIAALRRDPRVLAVEEDGVASSHDVGAVAAGPGATPRFMPRPATAYAAPVTERYANDPLLYTQLWNYAMVDAPRTWKVQTGDASVLVGVIDTGIRPDHPAVAPLLSTTDQYDFVSNDVVFPFAQPICGLGQTFVSFRGTTADEALPRNSALEPRDVFIASSTATCWSLSTLGAHGTHVAGTIGSPGDDGIGGTGLNWNVRIRPVRALGITGQGFFFDIAQAVLYQGGLPAAVPGSTTGQTVQTTPARVINMSLGGGGTSTVLQNAVSAASVNSLIVASAGNSSSSSPSIPASYADVLSVVSLAPDYQLASYTNVGATVDVAAPGGDFRVGSTAGVVSSTWDFVTNSPNYAYFQGTSMAASHVTGVAALVLAASPGLTPPQLRMRIEQGAQDLGPPGRDNRFGAGVINAFNSVTGTSGAVAATTVRAVNTSSGVVTRSSRLSGDGRFIFGKLPEGSYYLVAAQDEANDNVFGAPGRRFGWFGGTGMTGVSVAGSAVENVALSLGAPIEVEPNDDNARAQPLVVDAWVAGQLTAPDPKDVYMVLIPTAGVYTFETSGVLGACGQALEVDTVLRLFDAAGSSLGVNDDTPWPTASYPSLRCSRISLQLQPGRYFVEVAPVSASAAGNYRLHVRPGS